MVKAVSRLLWLLTVAAILALSCKNAEALLAPTPVKFAVTVVPADPRIGEYVQVQVHAAIAPSWHVYSIVPVPAPGPIATSISVNSQDGLDPASVKLAEDAPVVEFDPNFGKSVAYHVGTATFTVYGRLVASLPKSSVWSVKVHYEVCNASNCILPPDANLHVAVDPSQGTARPEYASMPSFPAPVVIPMSVVESTVKRATIAGGSIWAFAGAAFAAGLLALLTPCVFPLIPVTFGFFTKQIGEGTPGEIRRKMIVLASVYASGIVISFTALGLLAAIGLGASGANRIAANPWFNLCFGVLFVVFALSFFEAVSFTLPQFAMKFVRPSSSRGGVGSVLLMGLAFVFAAFTCTAPFIGTVLVAAATANSATAWLRPVIGMVSFSLALALPFFAIALFPGLLAKLPRSGGWLTRFKATLGFVELAYALTYFSKADLAWQAHVLTRAVFLGLWAMIAFGAGLYLVGLLRVSRYPDEPTPLGFGRGFTSVVFMGFSGFCLYALTDRPISASVAAFLPPQQYGLSSQTISSMTGKSLASDSDWLDSLDAGIAQAHADGKPVFVDFTGHACTNCRYVELNTFTKEPVTDLLTNSFDRVRLYTDSGPGSSANEDLQQKLTGTVALPLYAIVDSSGKLVNTLSGSSASVDQFATFLRSGLPSQSSVQTATSTDIAWAPLSDGAISSAKESKTPIIIDFTASWCTNCHAIEKNVFTSSDVSAELGKFVTLRSDLSDFYSGPNSALEAKYNVQALPAIVFLSADGKEIPDTRLWPAQLSGFLETYADC